MGQPSASVTSRGYMLGYSDLKDPSVSGFFRFLAKGRGQRDENADRKDRIWRQTMKYAGMPFGMWVLFAGSFQKPLTAAPTRGTVFCI